MDTFSPSAAESVAAAAAGLDEARRLSGSEVLLATDAALAQLHAVRGHPGMRRLAEAFAARGLPVRVMPASYSPHLADRARVSAWVADDVVCVGVTSTARTGQVLRAGARALGVLDGFPVGEAASALGRVCADACLEAFALTHRAATTDEPRRAGQVLLKRLSSRRLEGLDAVSCQYAAAHAWSVLCALPADEREGLREQCIRVVPQLRELLQRCEAAAGWRAPSSAASAAETTRRLVDALTGAVSCRD